MTFDSDYFNSIAAFFNSDDQLKYRNVISKIEGQNIICNINENITDNPEKFEFHIKYYIAHRRGDMVYVEFSQDYRRIKVFKFFKERQVFNPLNIPPWLWN